LKSHANMQRYPAIIFLKANNDLFCLIRVQEL
jgi:hypothetical protein